MNIGSELPSQGHPQSGQELLYWGNFWLSFQTEERAVGEIYTDNDSPCIWKAAGGRRQAGDHKRFIFPEDPGAETFSRLTRERCQALSDASCPANASGSGACLAPSYLGFYH